jgi:hypothetical protein
MPAPGESDAMFEAEKSSAGTESESKAEADKQEDVKAQEAEKADTSAEDPIKKELRARANKLQDERDALLKEKQDREAAEQKRKEKEAAEAGKFEELAATRERERDEAKNEATSLKAENDQLRAAITGVLDSEWKTLPVEVTDAYLGADDDPLAKLAFLPKGKVLAAKLTEKAETQRGNGRDPRAGTTTNGVSDEAARKANASRYA